MIGKRSFYHPILLSSYHPIFSPALAFFASSLHHDEPDLTHQAAMSLVLLSIIVVDSVSLTELIGVREGTAA